MRIAALVLTLAVLALGACGGKPSADTQADADQAAADKAAEQAAAESVLGMLGKGS